MCQVESCFSLCLRLTLSAAMSSHGGREEGGTAGGRSSEAQHHPSLHRLEVKPGAVVSQLH